MTLVGLAATLWLTDEVGITFHLMFVALTLAAFFVSFRPFVWRLFLWTLIMGAAIADGVSDARFDSHELVEVPLLVISTLIVFGIARSRAKTQRAQVAANESLAGLMRRYETVIASAPAVVYTAEIGADGAWLFASEGVQEILQISPDDLIAGRESLFERVHPADRNRVLIDELIAVETQQPLDCEYRVDRHDGKTIWVRDQATVVSAEAAKRPCLHGVITDITAIKNAEESVRSRGRQQEAVVTLGQLALEERNFDRLLDAAVAAVAATLNVELCEILELAADGTSLGLRAETGWRDGMSRAPVFVDGSSPAGVALLTRHPVTVRELLRDERFSGSYLAQEGVVSGVSVVIPCEAASYGILAAHAKESRDFTKEDVDFLVEVANVIASALRLELADARASFQLKRFEAAFEASVSGFVLVDPNGAFLAVNQAMCAMLRYTREELLASGFHAITHPDDLAGCIAKVQEVVAGTRDGIQFDKRYVTKQGVTVYANLSLSPVKDDQGRVLYLLAQSNDISDRVRAENERNRFFDASSDLLCVVSREGYFLQVSPSWERTLGYSQDELLRNPFLEFVHPDDRRSTESEAANLEASHSTTEFTNRYIGKDGRVVWLEWRAVLVPEEDMIYASARDISKHRELENQLRRSQKMEAIGHLAGGIAHDFNNILGVIRNYAEFVSEEVSGMSPEVKSDLDEIRAATHRGAKLVRQLLTFSRRDVAQPAPISLNASLEDARKFLQRTLGEDIELHVNLGASLWPTTIDPGHADQILLNLAVNARDAMVQGGLLSVETGNLTVDETFAQLHPGLDQGDFVVLSVSDDGGGMSDEVRDRIFEPFFTTKVGGKGTGLGLATVYGIVQEAGGYVSVYSELGYGTTFRIYLPRSRDSQAALMSGPEHSAEQQRGRGELVLVAEDDPALRSIIGRVLDRSGYQALVAASGQEALEVYRFDPGNVSVLLTDVVMPDMTGKELSDAIAAAGNGVKTIFMSGYTDEIISTRGVLPRGVNFIQKPFTNVSLLEGLRKALG